MAPKGADSSIPRYVHSPAGIDALSPQELAISMGQSVTTGTSWSKAGRRSDCSLPRADGSKQAGCKPLEVFSERGAAAESAEPLLASCKPRTANRATPAAAFSLAGQLHRFTAGGYAHSLQLLLTIQGRLAQLAPTATLRLRPRRSMTHLRWGQAVRTPGMGLISTRRDFRAGLPFSAIRNSKCRVPAGSPWRCGVKPPLGLTGRRNWDLEAPGRG